MNFHQFFLSSVTISTCGRLIFCLIKIRDTLGTNSKISIDRLFVTIWQISLGSLFIYCLYRFFIKYVFSFFICIVSVTHIDTYCMQFFFTFANSSNLPFLILSSLLITEADGIGVHENLVGTAPFLNHGLAIK